MKLFIVCYYGSEIEFNSKALLREIFTTNWFKSDKSMMKDLVILQENLKKPDSIRAANFLNIDLEIFLTVVRGAYALLAVLKEIKF